LLAVLVVSTQLLPQRVSVLASHAEPPLLPPPLLLPPLLAEPLLLLPLLLADPLLLLPLLPELPLLVLDPLLPSPPSLPGTVASASLRVVASPPSPASIRLPPLLLVAGPSSPLVPLLPELPLLVLPLPLAPLLPPVVASDPPSVVSSDTLWKPQMLAHAVSPRSRKLASQTAARCDLTTHPASSGRRRDHRVKARWPPRPPSAP
jgi:hypothetical protein